MYVYFCNDYKCSIFKNVCHWQWESIYSLAALWFSCDGSIFVYFFSVDVIAFVPIHRFTCSYYLQFQPTTTKISSKTGKLIFFHSSDEKAFCGTYVGKKNYCVWCMHLDSKRTSIVRVFFCHFIEKMIQYENISHFS